MRLRSDAKGVRVVDSISNYRYKRYDIDNYVLPYFSTLDLNGSISTACILIELLVSLLKHINFFLF